MYDPFVAPLTIDPSNVDALIDDVAGHVNAQHGRLIDITIWLLANTQEWQGDGLWTPAQYLAWRTGVSPAVASNLVAVAERADDFPVAISTVRRGEMSLDQLLPIIRHVPAWADAQMTSLAHKLTVSQVRRLVRETDWAWTPGPAANEAGTLNNTTEGRAHRQTASLLGDDEPTDRADTRESGNPECDEPTDDRADEPDLNRVNYGFGDNGRWYLHADLDADLGAQIHESLDEARDALFRERNHRNSKQHEAHGDAGQDGTPPAQAEGSLTAADSGGPNVIVPVSDTEAFASVARRSMDHIESPDRRDRYRVNLFLDLDGNCTTTEHISLPDSLRDLLTCDGRIDPVFVSGAIPISIGRSSRVIPDRLRRIVLHRDHGCCQVPSCTATRGLALHHIVHWSHGGSTDSENLITVCARHHRMHHTKRLGINGNADDASSLEFTDHRGMPIRASGAHPIPPVTPPPPIHGEYVHPIGEQLDRRWVTFIDPGVPVHLRHSHPSIAG